ncbi:NAD(P)-dependent oxidoreductase [Sphingobacteriaceae bacterium WQ 2009]|uniref:NAD(P)-dependent oxidoreductase n=1 Tax=Rhinopithecimicrobium faecis TaxID=2820698 RepID=A0A8T4HDM6_9SPHI|nr:NAD(P)-dependent oxidoreductase [Sphingobacteriaceae bacterium WQ 2009]
MAKITLIGASGFVGSALLIEALNRGIEVTAVVRNPEKITLTNKNLTIVKADVFNAEELKDVLAGSDAVVSAFSPGWTNPDLVPDTARGHKSIIAATKKAHINRLITVGGAGTLFVSPGATVISAGLIPKEILPGVQALAEVLENDYRTEKDLDWVFFSPAGEIAPGVRTGTYRLGKDDLIVDAEGKSKISVEDYAKALFDELETPAHHQERFTIGY